MLGLWLRDTSKRKELIPPKRSLVVKMMVTFKTILSITATKRLFISQMDVNNVFLQGKLNEDVYVKLPQGFGDERM